MQTLALKNGKVVSVAGSLVYRVEDLLLLYQTLHHAEGTVITIAQGALAAAVEAAAELDACAIAADAARRADLGRYGLRATSIFVTTLAPVRTLRLLTEGGYVPWGSGLDTSAPTRL